MMLIVEDNPADVVFFGEAIEASDTLATLRVVTNGEDALRFLRRQTPFADAPRPDVIVLDLNLPLKNGEEVLQEMMDEPPLRTIPVAILTTSSSESHLCDAHPNGCCQYFTKTAELGQLQGIVRQIVSHAHSAARGSGA
jgi:CheY-like chemotaxis protein